MQVNVICVCIQELYSIYFISSALSVHCISFPISIRFYSIHYVSDNYVPSLQCGSTMTGTVTSSWGVIMTFQNVLEQSVTFTNCNSQFDTKMYLYTSGIEIQSQSTNACDGDDCTDSNYCNTTFRETFTMSRLDPDNYTLILMPFSSDSMGDYEITVFCENAGLSCLCL